MEFSLVCSKELRIIEAQVWRVTNMVTRHLTDT
jgi:hypothetical protein